MYACLRITITLKIYVARHVSRITFIRYAQSRMIGTPNIFLNGSNKTKGLKQDIIHRISSPLHEGGEP